MILSSLYILGCHRKGFMIYIWWECPIRGFWNSIFVLLGLQEDGNPHNSQITLLIIPVDRTPKNYHWLIFLILLDAKMTIARVRKQTSVCLAQTKEKMTWIMIPSSSHDLSNFETGKEDYKLIKLSLIFFPYYENAKNNIFMDIL